MRRQRLKQYAASKNGLLRRAAAILLCVPLLFLLASGLAFGSETADAFRENRFTVSIYNDLSGEYILTTRQFTASGVTIFRTINLLKVRGYISDFTQSESELLELSYYVLPPDAEGEEPSEELLPEDEEAAEPETVLLRANDVERFYVKRNGVLVSPSQMNDYMREGDIVEWIYGEPPERPAEREPEASEPERPAAAAEQWNARTARALDSACDWLRINPDSDSLYLTAMGIGGESADMRIIGEVLAQSRLVNEETSPEELARLALNLSFCGYDRNDPELADLLNRLISYTMTENNTLSDRAYSLLAYDCRSYTLPNAANNSRAELIRGMLALQQQDGGFAPRARAASDPDATALALIALSRYPDQEEAARQAVNYLSSVQTSSGGFRQGGQVNSRTLSRVITALHSMGMADDERFMKEAALVDRMLDYASGDGGFALVPGGASNAEATEAAIIALGAVKSGGNPLTAPAVPSVPTVAPPVTVPEETNPLEEYQLYLWIGGFCLAAFFVLLGVLIHILRKSRKDG